MASENNQQRESVWEGSIDRFLDCSSLLPNQCLVLCWITSATNEETIRLLRLDFSCAYPNFTVSCYSTDSKPETVCDNNLEPKLVSIQGNQFKNQFRNRPFTSFNCCYWCYKSWHLLAPFGVRYMRQLHSSVSRQSQWLATEIEEGMELILSQ